MGLKQQWYEALREQGIALNRTIVGLKLEKHETYLGKRITLNRTIVGLKRGNQALNGKRL